MIVIILISFPVLFQFNDLSNPHILDFFYIAKYYLEKFFIQFILNIFWKIEVQIVRILSSKGG